MASAVKRPQIDIGALPENERPLATHINQLLTNMDMLVDQFRAALFLFDYASKKRADFEPHFPHYVKTSASKTLLSVSLDWQLIACRDAVMTVWHFGRIRRVISHQCGTLPTLFEKIDRAKIRASRVALEKSFPKYETMRTAVAHFADFISSTDNLEEHADSQGLFIHYMLDGRTYSVGSGGSVIHININDDSAKALLLSRNAMCEAFFGAAAT